MERLDEKRWHEALEPANQNEASFDLARLVRQYPLLAFGSAVGVGFGLGSMGGGSGQMQMSKPDMMERLTAKMSNSPRMGTADFAKRYVGAGATPQDQRQLMNRDMLEGKSKSTAQSFMARIVPNEAQEELRTIGNATINAARQWLRDTMRQYVPSASEHVDELDRRSPLVSHRGGMQNPSVTESGGAQSQSAIGNNTSSVSGERPIGSNFSI
jgi:hypothetical protein